MTLINTSPYLKSTESTVAIALDYLYQLNEESIDSGYVYTTPINIDTLSNIAITKMEVA